MRKTVSGIILSLLLVGMLTFAYDVQPVKASGTIYIRSLGSVDPSTAPILRNGNLYTLTGNITSDADGIIIERDNIILDGAGYTLQGIGGWEGIMFWGRNNVTIRNIEITQFWYGIEIGYSTNVRVSGNNITTNGGSGIELMSSSNNAIVGNVITGNSWNGIWLGFSSKYNVISGNTLTNNWYGIGHFSSSSNRISANSIEANYVGINLYESSDNSIVGNDVTANSMYGMEFYQSPSNVIAGNNVANNYYGITLFESSSNNAIYHNNFVNNVQQVYTYNSVNVWDDGYPSGGNYWSDYMGGDLDNDGIGDTPYIIDAGNIDRYPIMKASASTVYLYPSTIITEAGKTFSVSVMASRVQNLWAWQAGIQWDPAILEYVSHSWGEFRAIAGTSQRSPLTIDGMAEKSSKPALESALRGWFAPVSTAEVTLLTITFRAIKAGTCSLRLIDVSLRRQDTTGATAYPRWSDVNGDGVLGSEDVTSTFTHWEGGYYDQTTDFNDDGLVDITDISIVTSDFGKRNTEPEWGVTNTIYDVPAAIVSAQIYARPSEACIFSVPYHAQETGYWCGPASLEMIFDFYGPDISQLEIADAVRTAPDGTYTCDMVRAAHFSNLSTSMGREMPSNITGYSARKLGYAAFECGGMTIDDLKSLIITGYPIIVCTSWHYRVVVGFDSTYITFQDSLYGSMYQMTYAAFDTDWDYSGHWGLFVSPWNVEVSNPRNVLTGDVFDVTATITYPWAPPFPNGQYPASVANATITLHTGLSLVPGEMAKKPIGWGDLLAGNSATLTWTVQADSPGNYAILIEAEGKVTGFVPPLPSYNFGYNYEDRIGGIGRSIAVVSSYLDESPPTTTDDYDGLWHNQIFRINLAAEDEGSGVLETYYRINNGPTQALSLDGQPLIAASSANNTLEYWSEDWAGNYEFPHKFLSEIKLDAIGPIIGVPQRSPSGAVQPTQEVKVTVAATDALTGVRNLTLSYTVNDGITWENQPMSYNASTGLYEATIPSQPPGTWVKFMIVAYDNLGNRAVKDDSGRYYAYQVQYKYRLRITLNTPDGTTNPVPSTYFYWSETTVNVTAIPLMGYMLDHWELDSVNVGSANPYTVLVNRNQTLKVFFSPIPPPPLIVSTSPLSASLYVGDSLTFTSNVTGGIPPYSYQWLMDGYPVQGAISASWTFTPTTSGTYNVCLEATDNSGSVAVSEMAKITVTEAPSPPPPPVTPVGGYSFSIEGQATAHPLTLYLTLTAILAAVFTMFRRRRE